MVCGVVCAWFVLWCVHGILSACSAHSSVCVVRAQCVPGCTSVLLCAGMCVVCLVCVCCVCRVCCAYAVAVCMLCVCCACAVRMLCVCCAYAVRVLCVCCVCAVCCVYAVSSHTLEIFTASA